MEIEDPPNLPNSEEIQNIENSELRDKVTTLFDYYQRRRDDAIRYKKGQVELEQELFEVQQQSGSVSKKLHDATQANTDLREQLKTLESERTERTRRLFELESTYGTNESQKAQLKRQVEQLSTDKSNLAEVIQQKNDELETKKAEISSLHEELRTAINQKCEMQIKMGDLESRELAVEYREKRLKEERELLIQEKEWLVGEVRERDVTVQQLRKENNKRDLEFQTATTAKDEELGELKSALEHSKTQCARLTEQVENLNSKLKEASEERANKDESYEKEIQCHMKLAQIYKASSEEGDAKVEELTTTLDNIQQLFNEAKEHHFSAQEEINQLRMELDERTKEKDGVIIELKDELEKANELLRSKHRVLLSDEEVAALSPAAAAASKLIKTGMSLTQIYREHLKTVEELEMQKMDSKRIEGYFRELVHDIEVKAPQLRQQQESYSRALTTIENLKRQLEQVGKDQQTISNDKDNMVRELVKTRAELERNQRENMDLANQVRQLVWYVERIRAGAEPSMEIGEEPSIEDLHTFRNIDELQAQNQRLISALREAEVRRDEMVKAAQVAEMAKIHAEMEGMVKEVEQLREQREKHNQLLEAVRDERNTFKRRLEEADMKYSQLVSENRTPASSYMEKPELQVALEKSRMEFEVYQKQKNETERFLQDKLSGCEETIAGLRSTVTKLNAEVEYQSERFKVLNGNVDTYKREINGLRERNEKSVGIIGKQEQSMKHMTDELLSKTEDLSRLTVENKQLQQQLLNARSGESMAQKEVDLLRKNQHTQQMVAFSLKEMDARLTRREAEDSLRMKTELETLTKERNNLQANIKAQTEQVREYVRDCKTKIAELEAKLGEEHRQVEHLRSQLQWTEEQLSGSNVKADELKNELDKLQSNYQDASAGRFQKEAQQLQTRLNSLESRYTEATKRIDELTGQVNTARNEVQHYQRLSESFEGGLKEYKDTSQAERTRYDADIDQLRQQIDGLTKENATLKSSLDMMKQTSNNLLRQGGEKETSWTARVEALEKELAVANGEIEEWTKREREIRTERDSLAEVVKEFREKFESEFTAHGQSREELATAQGQLQEYLSQISTFDSRMVQMNSEIETQRATLEQQTAEFEAELSALKQNHEEAKKSNEILMDEMQKLTNQVAMFERLADVDPSIRAASGPDSLDLSSGSEGAVNSGIMEVIQCLRRERSQLAEKNDYMNDEVMKFKAREKVLEKEMDELRTELTKMSAEAAVAQSVTAEKTRLLNQLSTLQNVQASNDELKSRLERANGDLASIRNELDSSQDVQTKLHSQLEEARNNLEQSQARAEQATKDVELWQSRHRELMEQRATFEPERMSHLQAQVADYETKLDEYKKETDRLRSLDQRVAELDDQNRELKSELERAGAQVTELNGAIEAREKTLLQVRQVALKYRNETRESDAKVATINASLNELKSEKEKLENDKKELEARCNLLEANLSKQSAVAGLDPSSDAAVRINDLTAKLQDAEKKWESLRGSMTETGKKLVAAQADKKQLEQTVEKLQEDLKNSEKSSAELQRKMTALEKAKSILKTQVDQMMNQYSQLSEQYQTDKTNWERQSQEAKAPSSKSTPVQLVSAMPIPAAAAAAPERPNLGGNHDGARMMAPIRPSTRNIPPTVASVRPIAAAQRATPPVLSTAASQGPVHPDQSSSSSAPPVPISISPASIISSSQQSQNAGVPHAVVSPHVDLGGVSASSDVLGDISSSEVLIFADEPITSEASTSQPEAPSVAQKRRPPQDPSSNPPKRARAESPSQTVTTSDAPAASSFVGIPSLPEELVESAEAVESSLDDANDEVIFLDEVEPESTDQGGQSFDENRGVSAGMAAVASAAASEASSFPPGHHHFGGRQQAPPRLHTGGQWDMGMAQDYGVVPSTPTLMMGRRSDQEVASVVHVPQGSSFSWTASSVMVQEPIPTSQVFGGAAGEATTAQRSVPTTPRAISPSETGDREATSSSTVDIINVSGGDQPQPSGQSAEPEVIDASGIGEDQEGSSEAMAKPEGAESAGEEDSNEPTTSQQQGRSSRTIRLNRRPFSSQGTPSGAGTEASQSQPATSTTVRTPQNTARRGRAFPRGARGGGDTKKD